jgi:putative ABC transport system substrate-binding protein
MDTKPLLHLFLLSLLFLAGCRNIERTAPVVGFVEAFEDATIAQAREGFVKALADSGFRQDEGTIEIVFRNAQGDIPTLTQIVNYYLTEEVDLLATSTTLSTVTAIQRSKTTPIFMMVSPEPARMEVLDAQGNPPENLFGVSESLAYIDTSFSLIPRLIQPKGRELVVGMIYNQAEPQSQDALRSVQAMADRLGVRLEALPVNSSADAQLVTQSLLNRNIDAFFANPDNTVFAAFETILKNCNQRNVPIFTSEAGLVKRGAVAAFGADLYQWGYQSGAQAARYLKQGDTAGIDIELVRERKRVYNPAAAKRFGLRFPDTYQAIE